MPWAILLVAGAIAVRADDASPAWQRRGRLTDVRLAALSQRVDPFRKQLERAIEDAPDLAAKLARVPKGPTRMGWQVLPRIVPDPKRPATSVKPFPVWHTWAGADERISDGGKRLDEAIAALERANTADSAHRRDELAKAVDACIAAEDKRREAQSYASYNWLWQEAIPRERARFDEETRVHEAILERQSIREQLAGAKPEDEARLRTRDEDLTRLIQGHGQVIDPPAFVRVRRDGPRAWIIDVPVATDIKDRAFLAEFARAVETTWRAEGADGTRYAVRVHVQRVIVARLYPDGKLPVPGRGIDAAAHAARFQSNAAVLTTGAKSTHAIIGRRILLGPDDIAPNVLAHEFGHLLGFSDGYVRGYRDLGEDGLNVMEMVADPDDIMSNPGLGRVLARQLERLVAMKAPSRKPRG